MLQHASIKDAETELLASLNNTLIANPINTKKSADLDEASERIKQAIEKEGLFALTGVTSPYYELMLWKTQSSNIYRVALPEHTINLRVVFLDNFVSLGWAGFATCGRYHSGGWATEDSLFALKSAYDTKSEDFRVSYLAHEGQHFSDTKEFPKLEQPELEYRAKLTEIAVSKNSTYELITQFSERNGQDRSVPHHFANYWVAKDLSHAIFKVDDIVKDQAKWRNIPAAQVRNEARRLLKDNSACLYRRCVSEVFTQ